MICQVRSIANITLNLCARALLNLMSTEENLTFMTEGSIIRCFSSICTSNCFESTKHTCALAFLVFSSYPSGRMKLCKRIYDLQGLFSMINVKSEKTQIIIAKAACNMLLDENTRYIAIHANAITVLTIAATLDIPVIIEIVTQILICLAEDQRACVFLSKAPVVGILVYFLCNCTDWNFECALQAAATFASVPIFRSTMIDKNIISTILSATIKGKVVTEFTSQAAACCLSYLSFMESGRERLVFDSHAILLLHAIDKKVQSTVRLVSMFAIILRNLSSEPKVVSAIIEQRGAKLLLKGMKGVNYNQSFVLCQAAGIFIENISKHKVHHDRLMEEGDLMEVLLLVASAVSSQSDTRDRMFSIFLFIVLVLEFY
jgi:hypothetical protein